MRKNFYLLFLVLLVLVSCNDNSDKKLYRIQENGLYGFIDSLGNVAIKPQYKYVGPFTEDGYACVISNMYIIKDTISSENLLNFNHDDSKDSIISVTYGYINRDNELVIDTVNQISIRFANIEEWGGMQLIESTHKYMNGELDFKSSILSELNLCDGLFVFQDTKTGLFGYKDEYGKIKVEPKYICCRNFSNGIAIVRQDRKMGNVDISDILNNRCAINTKGDSLFSGYTVISDFRKDGMTWALTTSIDENSIKRDWVQIDKKGVIKTGPISNIPWIYNNEEYPICVIDFGILGTYYTFLNENGNFLTDFDHDNQLSLALGEGKSELFKDVTRFSNGVAGIKGYNENGDGAWFFVERNIIPISEPYDSLLPFSEGLAAVKELAYIGEYSSHLGKWGFVKMEDPDTVLVQTIPYTFSECSSFVGGLAYFMNEGVTFDVEGFINKRGEVIWQTKRKKIK